MMNAEEFSVILRMMIRGDIKHRDQMLQDAKKGDWAPLAKHIRGGGRVTPQMRPFLADVLDGAVTRPNKKISRAETRLRDHQLARFVWGARWRGEEDIAQRAEEEFGRSWRHLQKCLAKLDKDKTFKERLRKEHELISAIDRFLEATNLNPPNDMPTNLHEEAACIANRRLGGFKYLVSDMALTPHTLT
jgi:hypothetical protein